jgi:hypothetical protein
MLILMLRSFMQGTEILVRGVDVWRLREKKGRERKKVEGKSEIVKNSEIWMVPAFRLQTIKPSAWGRGVRTDG